MMENNFSYLEWDSDFFKKKIFKIDLDKSHKKSHIDELLNSFTGDLLYLFSATELNAKFSDDFFLADKKIIFHKQIYSNLATTPLPEIISVTNSSAKLFELAYLSGTFSRFKLDSRLASKFEELYAMWLNKSITKEIASEVLVYIVDDNEIGFVTIKKVENLAIIGLIAVESLFASKNIGTSLMLAVENWCINNDINEIEVATQLDNLKACNFYKKNGYSTKQINYVYHYYSKK